MALIKVIVEMMEDIIDVMRKSIYVFAILGYLVTLIISLVATLIGWYYMGVEVSFQGFIVLCMCLGILLHLGEKSKGSDNIGGKSNKKNDTELHENT